METMEAITGRAMYRGRLQNRKIEEPHLLQLLDAARWAPSGHNSQPWEFMVVDAPSTIEKIAVIASEAMDAFLASSDELRTWVERWCRWLRWSEDELNATGDGIFARKMSESAWRELQALASDEDIRSRLIAMFGSQGRPSKLITTAPCIIFTLVNKKRPIPDYSNDMMALTSAGAAMQNLRLAAHELGLAAHEQSPLYDLPETREAIGRMLLVPDHYHIVGAMRLGYPTQSSTSLQTHTRRPVKAAAPKPVLGLSFNHRRL